MTATAVNPAAIMASPDYQAWAETDEAAPAPPPGAPGQTIREWSFDPADTAMPPIDPLSAAAALSVLSTDEINVAQALVGAGHALARAAGDRETWGELIGLSSDFLEAWTIAFEREHPGEHKRQARDSAGITCGRCGARGQHLKTFRYWTQGVGNEDGLVTEWHCTDIRACNERLVPAVKPLIISDELIAAAEYRAEHGDDDEQAGESR